MNTRRIDTILAIAIIMAVLPVCTQAIPMPHGVAGTVYRSDGVTQAPAGTSFNVTTNEAYIEGTTGAGPFSGAYLVSIDGSDGDPVTVYAWNATHYGANTTTLSSDAITTMDVIIDTPFADNSPYVTVLHPNGGESIPTGTQVQVSAHATDDTAVTSVTFSYSSNGGSDWNPIGAGTRFSGTDKDGIWNQTWNTNSLGAGSNYLVRAVADDGTSTREDQSDSTFSLTCTPPSAPALNDPGTTDTDGSYTVSWSSVSGATSYTLEEDTSGSFGSPTVVYSGSGTSTQITGMSDGTYYYRVKACNACGCGGWSNVGDIEVEIPDPDIIQVPEDYSTIQAAVDAASSGTIIQVSAGTYIENIVIGKDNITLEGESKNITIIDGGQTGTCVRVTADSVEISGFMIINGITGVYIESSTGSIINNNRISDHCEGVYIANSNNNTIAYNIITDTRLCFSGIHLSSSEDNMIHDNDLSDNRDGIYIYNSNNNRIYHNNLIGNTYQAYDNTGTNHWDNNYTSGGNYWNDHTSIDTFSGPDQNVLGSDGIGDAHYGISGGASARDRYPFMSKGGWVEENIPPVASFTYSPLNPVVNQTVVFDLSSSYDPDGEIVYHQLNFGDGGGAEGPGLIETIGYDYSFAGNYSVTLIVTDNDGYIASETKIIAVVDGDTTISIADASAPSSHTTTTQITINNMTNFGAATVTLSYDPTLVRIASITAGDVGTPTANIHNTAGTATIAAHVSTATGPDSPIAFANIELLAVGSDGATSPLTLAITTLTDVDENSVPATAESGVFTISGLRGDANDDGAVNAIDAMFVAQYTAGNRDASTLSMANADADLNGDVDVVDAMFIAQYVAGARTW